MATSKIKARNPYVIIADNGDEVNVQTSSPNRKLTIHGHEIRVSQIPITVARLSCGHSVRGIAFSEGMLVHCDQHGENTLLPTTVSQVM